MFKVDVFGGFRMGLSTNSYAACDERKETGHYIGVLHDCTAMRLGIVAHGGLGMTIPPDSKTKVSIHQSS